MPEEYTALVTALKALTQGESPNVITLPMAENGWNTRPDTESYGIVSLDFEVDALVADNEKLVVSHEGSVDLYSRSKSGDGWIPLIIAALKAHCGPCWSLNSHTYENESRLFHWEWTFQVMDTEVTEPEQIQMPEEESEEDGDNNAVHDED